VKFNFLNPATRTVRILEHIVFWCAALLLFTFIYGRISSNFYGAFIFQLFTLPIYLLATYFTLYLIIPKYLLTKKYKKLLIAAYYLILGSAYLEILLTIYLLVIPPAFLTIKNMGPLKATSLDIYMRLIGIYAVVFFASIIKLIKNWYNIQTRNQELQKEKLEAELNFLKSQVHPHFLFNTLNNLYALTLKKSEKSPEIVLKLSEILDYMLYESKEGNTILDKEIKLIKNYITLEELRFGNRLKINIDINGNTTRLKIAPLILFPFVENSFKHGVSKTNESAEIEIKINVEENILLFEVKNSKPKSIIKNEVQKGNGIGLQNITKRLNLLYKDSHWLEIKDTSESYYVKLKIDLREKMFEENL
jgi:two-component system, LytTR family, sensor kinase